MTKPEYAFIHIQKIRAKYSRHACLVAACLLAPAVQAQNVLLLSARESGSNPALVNKLEDSFVAAGASVTEYRQALNGTTPMAASLLDGRDIVVVISPRGAMKTAHLPVLQEAIESRRAA